VVVAFKGMEPFDADEWITTFNFSWCKMGSIRKINVGFLGAMGLADRCDQQIFKTHLELKREDIYHDHEDAGKTLAYYAICRRLSTLLKEHSLGGSLDILFPAILLLHKKIELMEQLLAVYTFGQPRVGDREFKDFMNMNLNALSFKRKKQKHVFIRIEDCFTSAYVYYRPCPHWIVNLRHITKKLTIDMSLEHYNKTIK